MSKAQRDKGRRGEAMARRLLKDRDWITDRLAAGFKHEDLIATDPHGIVWSVEIKNCKDIKTAHRDQASMQAARRKLPWMLMSKIHGTRSWLIQRKGELPTIWSEKQDTLI